MSADDPVLGYFRDRVDDSIPWAMPAPPDLPEEVVAVRVVPKPPHPGFWWAVLWCVGYFVLLNVVSAVVGGVMVIVLIAVSPDPQACLRELGTARFQRSAEYTRLTSVAMAPALLCMEFAAVVFAWLAIRIVVGKDWKRRLSLCGPGAVQLILVLLALPAMVVLSNAAYQAAGLVLPSFDYQHEMEKLFSAWPVWFAVLVVGLAAPVAEELWFRGFLGRGLVGRHGAVFGVLLCSVLFGLFHLDPPHVVATIVIGIILHGVYLATRSLWMPVLLHVLNNTLAVAGGAIPQIERLVDQKTGRFELGVYGAAGLLLAAVAVALYQARTRLATNTDGGEPAWRPRFPGVESPPPGTGTFLVRRRPGWPACVLLATACLVFAVTLCITSR